MKILKIIAIVLVSSLIVACSSQNGVSPKGECPYKKYQCDKSKKDGAVCPYAKKCKKKGCESYSKSCSKSGDKSCSSCAKSRAKSDAKACSKCKSCSKNKAATCSECKSCADGKSCSDCPECSGK